jgi:hypothetical protein
VSTQETNRSDGNLNHRDNARLTMDFIHRLMMHHAMWYGEVQQHLGREKAQEILKMVYERSSEIQMRKLSKTLGFDLEENIPAPLLNLSPEKLDELKKTIAVNWLANDGVWFQAVEFSMDMTEAKKCNDSCWSHFSPFEAWSIFVFQMNDCRVQSARKRKGLSDYPCKSAGIIEYTTFAESIDSRIQTSCISCPPDPHPEEWYCAWRFSIKK